MATGEGWNVDRAANQKLWLSTWFFLHRGRPKQQPHYGREGQEKEEAKILKLLNYQDKICQDKLYEI